MFIPPLLLTRAHTIPDPRSMTIYYLSAMNLRAALLEEHSKDQAEAIAKWVGGDQQKLEALLAYYFGDDWRITHRAAYAIAKITDRNPSLLDPYLHQFVEVLGKDAHDAVKRNSLRLFRDHKIPPELAGDLMEYCFDFAQDPTVPIAFQCFALHILDTLTWEEPDLRRELHLIIEHREQEDASPGYKSVARKIRKRDEKLRKQK